VNRHAESKDPYALRYPPNSYVNQYEFPCKSALIQAESDPSTPQEARFARILLRLIA